jgi:hypothetical protein
LLAEQTDRDNLAARIAAAKAAVAEAERIAAEKRRVNYLGPKRQHMVKLAAAEDAKFDLASQRIDEARDILFAAEQDLRNARIVLATRIEQRDSALQHRTEHEAQIAAIDDELTHLALSPTQRAQKAARQDREAYLNELITVDEPYVRGVRPAGRPRADAGPAPVWVEIEPPGKIQIMRRHVEKHEADMAEAAAWLAEQKAADAKLQERDDLAAAYEQELRDNPRQIVFRSSREKAAYDASMGKHSPRAKAYRSRQLERGLSIADPEPPTRGRSLSSPSSWSAGV